VLTSPFTPMLFMGEEWGADTPWQYFTDHIDPELAVAVARGRKAEFTSHGWGEADVPDPQDPQTFLRSKLDWTQRDREPYNGILAWYRELIALRRARPELTDPRLDRVQADFDEDARWLMVRRDRLRIVANLGEQAVRLPLGQRGTGLLAASSPGVAITQDTVAMPPAAFAVIETMALRPEPELLTGADRGRSTCSPSSGPAAGPSPRPTCGAGPTGRAWSASARHHPAGSRSHPPPDVGEVPVPVNPVNDAHFY